MQSMRAPRIQHRRSPKPSVCTVAAFFKWLSVKYPKIVVDCTEERAKWSSTGEKIPVDTSTPNPNGLEFDNLYLDMNGIIHPASHPEDRSDSDWCSP